MALKQKNIHRIITAIYMCLFQAAIVLPILAIREDKLAVITGRFKSQTGILGSLLDVVVQHDLFVTIHQKEMIISLEEDGILVPSIDAIAINYKDQCNMDTIPVVYDEDDRKLFCQLELG